MSRRMLLRYALPAVLTAALLPAAAICQSQDSQSVAEAARRAREKKRAAAKSAKVITDDDVKPASPAAAGNPAPAAASSTAPAAPADSTAANAAQAPAANAANAPAEQANKDEKEPKEVTDLKEQIKQLQSDLDLLQRELRLDQDTLYSKPDYANDKAGIEKMEGEKQQVSDKQVDLDRLKSKLAEMLQSLGIPTSAPPKP